VLGAEVRGRRTRGSIQVLVQPCCSVKRVLGSEVPGSKGTSAVGAGHL